MAEKKLMQITIGDFLDKTAKKFPNRDALVFPDKNLRYNWKEFKAICDEIARGFIAIGIKKGDHVALWATNYPEWVIAQFALAKIGAVLVTVNPAFKVSEVEYVLKQSDSKVLILIESFKTSNYLSTIQEICPELKRPVCLCFRVINFFRGRPKLLKSKKLPKLENVILIGEKKLSGMLTWQEILERGRKISNKKLFQRQKSISPHDVVVLQYTSGTTGFPKGAMLTHFGIVNNIFWVARNIRITWRDRICLPVPFFHAFGCLIGNIASLVTGAVMIVPSEYFEAEKVLKAIEKEKCTVIYGVPTMFIAELSHPEFDRFDLSSLRAGTMGGAPCPIQLMKNIVEKMGAKEMTISYGLTEASSVVTQTLVDDPIALRVSSVGKALPSMEVKIVEPQTGKEVPCGASGELLVRGYNVMKGYYKKPKETQETIDRDGWLHTGDVAQVDQSGYYRISGRIKDMLIRGGENIYPREIEEFLFTHPKIEDVQVVGVPSEKFGEEVAACIKVKKNQKLTEEEVRNFCQDKIAHYKIPKYIVFMDEFPITATGKIQKFKLREILIKKLGLEEIAKIKTA